MNIDFLNEPELEFGSGKHIDIRFGLMNYGPFDFSDPISPVSIHVGVVGTPESIEKFKEWVARCKNGIPAKDSRQPNLFPKFPGFGSHTNLPASFLMNTQLERPVQHRIFDILCKTSVYKKLVEDAVQLYFNELQYLAQNTNANVLLCLIPMNLYESLASEASPDALQRTENLPDENDAIKLDFHDLLKAKAMQLRTPIQIVLPMTYDNSLRRKQKRRIDKNRELQDEATRAWNLYTALYYKAGGIPWRLTHDPAQLTTCFAGISFYKTLDKMNLQTSIAQVFNQRGEGVILRGGNAEISKEDRTPHLNNSEAYRLLNDALKKYRDEHHTFPARIVLHKSSPYNDEEKHGFKAAISENNIDSYDFINMSKTFTRLFRNGEYPPLRGTLFNLSEKSHILYTRGSVEFFSTYPGLYVPRPLNIICEFVDQTPKYLANEILALTKMNWNNTQFDGGEPITLRAAREVGSILRYIGAKEPIEPNYRFYM